MEGNEYCFVFGIILFGVNAFFRLLNASTNSFHTYCFYFLCQKEKDPGKSWQVYFSHFVGHVVFVFALLQMLRWEFFS